MRVRRHFAFEAAHELPNHPGKCQRLHGHSFKLAVTVERPVDPVTGMSIDFGDLKKVVNEWVVDRLDHRYINDFIELPTAENMAVWSWNELAPRLEGLEEIELHETARCSVVYRGE